MRASARAAAISQLLSLKWHLVEGHQPFSKAGQCGIEVKGIFAVAKLPRSAAVDTCTSWKVASPLSSSLCV